mgnify:CR=1 FL=1
MAKTFIRHPLIIKIVFSLLLLFFVLLKVDVAASPLAQSNTVNLNMYVLVFPSGARDPDNRLCNTSTITRRSWGCTFYPNDPIHEYPFTSSNITVGIENHIYNSVQQGYLHNVVPQELDPGHAASSVRAQAIAARTYAYRQILDTGTLNNSNQFQVYIPYRYDTLSAAHKTVIDQAMVGQVYMSLPGSTNPIAAFFT